VVRNRVARCRRAGAGAGARDSATRRQRACGGLCPPVLFPKRKHSSFQERHQQCKFEQARRVLVGNRRTRNRRGLNFGLHNTHTGGNSAATLQSAANSVLQLSV
jgi:hypothetical protein